MPGLPVRVVGYDVPGRDGEVVTLVTSITTYQDFPAPGLAAACHERRETGLAFDEIETRQRGPAAVLRSRSPDLVRQELYGLLLTCYAARRLMTEAVGQAGLGPDRLSFTRTLRIPRTVKRGRHNSYRIKRKTDTITRHEGPPEIHIYAPAA